MQKRKGFLCEGWESAFGVLDGVEASIAHAVAVTTVVVLEEADGASGVANGVGTASTFGEHDRLEEEPGDVVFTPETLEHVIPLVPGRPGRSWRRPQCGVLGVRERQWRHQWGQGSPRPVRQAGVWRPGAE